MKPSLRWDDDQYFPSGSIGIPTYRRKLGVIFPYTLYSVQFHVDLLTRSQFCKHDVSIRWRRRVVRHHDCLFALRRPLELRR